MTMNKKLTVFEEPALEFRYGQKISDPHDGLSMFGPFDGDLPSHPKNISYAIVGTPAGFEKASGFLSKLNEPILMDETNYSPHLWPSYPGFDAIFNSSWPEKPTRYFLLDEKKLLGSAVEKDEFKRVGEVVDLYLDGIQKILKRDDPVQVIICIVPDIVFQNCRIQSHVSKGTGAKPSGKEREIRKSGILDFFTSYNPDHYHYSIDFRRQIKARAMAHGVPIQIIRESTLSLGNEPEPGSIRRGLTPLSDRAWNLSTAIYYKAGGKPWKLSTAREGVCYIGIAYRLTNNKEKSKSACCAAQMFLDSGDGIVFMGEYGPWYSEDKKEFHLSASAAKNLLSGVLKTYFELEGKQLKEVFIHCRSTLNREELSGFASACPTGVKLVGIRVKQERRNSIKLFREGTRPVIRGSFWKINDRSGYLWTSGFKPRLKTYDGWEVPVPLKIDVQYGTESVEQVARDIFGLTKLNYNTCKLGDAHPVTIGFSDSVGEILVSNPTVKATSPKFKFYI